MLNVGNVYTNRVQDYMGGKSFVLSVLSLLLELLQFYFIYLTGCVTFSKESFLLLESLTPANLLDIK